MSDSSRSNDHQPDLRSVVCEFVNALMSDHSLPPEYRKSTTMRSEDITIRCQRTWYDIATTNVHPNGGALSACIALIASESDVFSFFVEAVRLPGTSDWGCRSMAGPKRYEDGQNRVGGFTLANGSHVCVGGLGTVPEGGTLRVDMADGTSFEDVSVDGCCIVFAPLTTALPPQDDYVTVRVLDLDGTELSADRAWFGGGDRPRSA